MESDQKRQKIVSSLNNLPVPATSKNYHLVVADGGKKDGIAYGSFIVFNDTGKAVVHKQHVFGSNTSNQAEYLALLSAVSWCVENDITNIVTFMDSLLTVNQVKGEWKCLNPGLLPLLSRIKRVLERFESFEITQINRRYIVQKLGH